MTPAGLKAAFEGAFASATEEKAGTVRLATPDEARSGEDQTTAVSPSSMKTVIDERAASPEEVEVGTANAKFVTPATLKTVVDGLLLKINELTERVAALETPVAATLEEPVKESNDGGIQ